MNDPQRREPGSGEPAAGRTDLDSRRRALDAGLVGARKRHEPPPPSARGAALGMAFRVATEMVAALLVGGFIGWQLDAWLGTRPVLFLLFLALGAAAGATNVIRHAYRMNRMAWKEMETGRSPAEAPAADGRTEERETRGER